MRASAKLVPPAHPGEGFGFPLSTTTDNGCDDNSHTLR